MITKTDTATSFTAFGKKLDAPINYSYSWNEYETKEEMIAAKDELTLEQQMSARNTARQNTARTRQLNATLEAAGFKRPTAETDEQVRLKDMFKTLQTAKRADGTRLYTDEQARKVAATTLGCEWAIEN